MKLPDRKQMLSQLLLTVALVIGTIGSAFAAPSLSLGTASGGAGTTVTIPVTLTNQTGVSIASLGFNLQYDATVLQNPTATVGAAATAAGKVITKNLVSNPIVVGVLAFDNVNAIGNGVVVNLTFDIKAGAVAGPSTLTFTPDGSDPNGDPVTVTGTNGTINIADTVKPVITLSTLTDGAKTNVSPLNVAGTATDNLAVTTLTVNGTAVTVGTGGAFSHALALTTGANTVTVTAADAAGNTTTEIRTVNYENVAPTLTVTSPATDNSFTNQATLTVSGTVNEATSLLEITLNGVVLTGVTPVNNNFTTTVTLVVGQNTINYSATDEFGNVSQSVKRTITYDSNPPSVAIIDPAQDLRTNKATYLVKGTVTDTLTTPTISMTFDGQTYNPAVTNGAFEQSITFPIDNTYAIIVTATDGAGNSSSTTRNIIYDTKAPSFAVTTPNLVTAASSFTLEGIKESGATVAATCATAATVTVSETDPTHWKVDLTGIAAGANTVVMTATLNNNDTPLSAVVIRDNTAPVVDTFTLPTLNNALTLPVSALVASDANGIAAYSVTESATAPAADATGWAATATTSFTFTTDGLKTLYAYAKDNAGNISAGKSATATIDTAAPVVGIITSPASLVNVAAADLTFSSTDATATFECKIDTGAFAACTSPKSYTQLADGQHSFTVQAKDLAGNISTLKTATWISDTTNPTLTVSALSNGAATNASPLNITGTVTDVNGIATVTVNGTAATVGASGAYSFALPLTVEGDVAVTVVATDNAGNVTTDSRTIKYDTTLPILTVTAPADNSQTKDASLVVSGTVTEAGTVDVVNTTSSTTQPATLTGSDYTATIQLVSGSNTIEVVTTDAAGNKSTAVKRTILYDPLSPALAITDPPQDTQLNGTTPPAVTIKGTVTDATNTIVTLTFNGTTYTPAVTAGAFEQAITMPAEGSFPVVATATDAVGNTPSTVTRNIIYTPYPGDTNGDGVTTQLEEVLKAFLHATGNGTITATEKVRLDCAPLAADGKPNPNGVVDQGDVILLLRRIVGLVSW